MDKNLILSLIGATLIFGFVLLISLCREINLAFKACKELKEQRKRELKNSKIIANTPQELFNIHGTNTTVNQPSNLLFTMSTEGLRSLAEKQPENEECHIELLKRYVSENDHDNFELVVDHMHKANMKKGLQNAADLRKVLKPTDNEIDLTHISRAEQSITAKQAQTESLAEQISDEHPKQSTAQITSIKLADSEPKKEPTVTIKPSEETTVQKSAAKTEEETSSSEQNEKHSFVTKSSKKYVFTIGEKPKKSDKVDYRATEISHKKEKTSSEGLGFSLGK